MQAKKIPLFRVDPTHYKIGDIITPMGNYQEKIGIEQQRIEDSLSRTSLLNSGVQRKSCVFLFDDLKNALLFLKNKTPKANLYKVSVRPEDFLYKGDMNYLDFLLEIVRNTKEEDDKQILDLYTKKYWEVGFGCASPCYELLVKKATIEERVMAANSEESQRFYLEFNKDSYVHLTNTYKALVGKYY